MWRISCEIHLYAQLLAISSSVDLCFCHIYKRPPWWIIALELAVNSPIHSIFSRSSQLKSRMIYATTFPNTARDTLKLNSRTSKKKDPWMTMRQDQQRQGENLINYSSEYLNDRVHIGICSTIFQPTNLWLRIAIYNIINPVCCCYYYSVQSRLHRLA